MGVRNLGRWLLLAGWLLAATVHAEPVDFTLPDLDGKPRQLSEFRGQWVLVNYWATWCPPCLDELPELEVFHANHQATDAVVIGINKEDIPLPQLRAFVEEQFLSFPILRDGAHAITVFGPVTMLPTSFLITPQGEVVASQVGPVDAESIERFIENHEQQQTDKPVMAGTDAAQATR